MSARATARVPARAWALIHLHTSANNRTVTQLSSQRTRTIKASTFESVSIDAISIDLDSRVCGPDCCARGRRHCPGKVFIDNY